MLRAPFVLSVAGLLVGGCSSPEPPDPPADADEASVFDPMTETIDRAREVEQQMNQRIDELNNRLDESEGQ